MNGMWLHVAAKSMREVLRQPVAAATILGLPIVMMLVFGSALPGDSDPGLGKPVLAKEVDEPRRAAGREPEPVHAKLPTEGQPKDGAAPEAHPEAHPEAPAAEGPTAGAADPTAREPELTPWR